MTAIVVIPARFGSTRFPAKILAADTGRPLVQHVVDQVGRCKRVSQVIVATDDARIASALEKFGTHCVMTSPGHASGTDRVAEVAKGRDEEIVVNVQGDEPEIDPAIVDGLIDRLAAARAAGGAGRAGGAGGMATAATPFPAGADPADPNLVKVVCDTFGRALYFSRSPVPYYRDGGEGGGAVAKRYLLHLGIYAYQREFLLRFASWPPTPLEQAEKLEQLRALEHGQAIEVLTVARATHGIDTPQQYQAFVDRFCKGERG